MKKFNRPQRYRLRRILESIRRGTRNGQLSSSQELSRELEVHHNTIRSDLACLRDDENAPIEYDPARHGYRLTDPTWEMPAFQISRNELFAFSVATKVITAFRGTPLETDMRSVMEKIQASLEGKVSIDPAAFTEHMTVWAEDYAGVDPAIWTAVARSLDRQTRIQVRYTKFDGTRGE